MNPEIIYEKKYPQINLTEEMKRIEQKVAKEPKEPKEPVPSIEELLQKLQANTTYVLMPERIKAGEKFIKTAIEVSELYQLDTRIERHFDHICVTYSFDCCGAMRNINRVFGMADQFAFFKDIHGFDITVSCDFFTHTAIRNGMVISP